MLKVIAKGFQVASQRMSQRARSRPVGLLEPWMASWHTTTEPSWSGRRRGCGGANPGRVGLCEPACLLLSDPASPQRLSPAHQQASRTAGLICRHERKLSAGWSAAAVCKKSTTSGWGCAPKADRHGTSAGSSAATQHDRRRRRAPSASSSAAPRRRPGPTGRRRSRPPPLVGSGR